MIPIEFIRMNYNFYFSLKKKIKLEEVIGLSLQVSKTNLGVDVIVI